MCQRRKTTVGVRTKVKDGSRRRCKVVRLFRVRDSGGRRGGREAIWGRRNLFCFFFQTGSWECVEGERESEGKEGSLL